MTRLPFILEDLDRAVRAIAPFGGTVEVVLPTGTFGPVVEALASHYSARADSGAGEYRVGPVMIRRAPAA